MHAYTVAAENKLQKALRYKNEPGEMRPRGRRSTGRRKLAEGCTLSWVALSLSGAPCSLIFAEDTERPRDGLDFPEVRPAKIVGYNKY